MRDTIDILKAHQLRLTLEGVDLTNKDLRCGVISGVGFDEHEGVLEPLNSFASDSAKLGQ